MINSHHCTKSVLPSFPDACVLSFMPINSLPFCSRSNYGTQMLFGQCIGWGGQVRLDAARMFQASTIGFQGSLAIISVN